MSKVNMKENSWFLFLNLFVIFANLFLSAYSLPKIPNFESHSSVISNFVASLFPNAKVVLIFADFLQTFSPLGSFWNSKKEAFLAPNHITCNSGGFLNIHINSNNSNSSRDIPRTQRTLSDVTQIVILWLPQAIPNSDQEATIFKRLNVPLLDPTTVRNIDKYLIITESGLLESLKTRDVIRRIKYKLFLTYEEDEIIFRQHCIHCPIPENKFQFSPNGIQMDSGLVLSVPHYFPDLQKNYHGKILRVSSTDKMGGDLEFAVNSEGKTYAKRGVFASAMYHLAEGLNFTAELYRSSAGASTGHRLPNGTWVGSVGDVYSGDASFCMLCGMSYNRHFIVEICSPVTYEYIRFAIGPSEKLYTWQAIFWPFTGSLWAGLLATAFVTILCSFLFLKFQDNHSTWSIVSVSQYFARIFIEQSQDIPYGLPESIKIVLGFWLLFALVGTTIYRAKMVTFMTFPVFEHTPDTYDELIHSNYQIEFHYFPNIAYNSFKTSTNPVTMEVFQKMLKQPDPIKCLQHTLASKSVCIMFTSVHEDMVNRNMSDRFGQSPIRSSSQYAFMFTPGISSQKRADFTPNFRQILQTSLQMGLNEWWERSDAYFLLKQKNAWIKNLPNEGNRTGVFQYDAGDSDDVMHLRHLTGAFTVLIGGWVFALGMFLSEHHPKIFGDKGKSRVLGKWKAKTNMITLLSYSNKSGQHDMGFSTHGF